MERHQHRLFEDSISTGSPTGSTASSLHGISGRSLQYSMTVLRPLCLASDRARSASRNTTRGERPQERPRLCAIPILVCWGWSAREGSFFGLSRSFTALYRRRLGILKALQHYRDNNCDNNLTMFQFGCKLRGHQAVHAALKSDPHTQSRFDSRNESVNRLSKVSGDQSQPQRRSQFDAHGYHYHTRYS